MNLFETDLVLLNFHEVPQMGLRSNEVFAFIRVVPKRSFLVASIFFYGLYLPLNDTTFRVSRV